MDEHYAVNGDLFVWNQDKAQINWRKHGVRFEDAAAVFSDPLFVLADASRNDEARDAAMVLTFKAVCCLWFTWKAKHLVSASSLRAVLSSMKM